MSTAFEFTPPGVGTGGALEVRVACTSCGRKDRHEVESATIWHASLGDPGVALPPDWDGFSTPTPLTCRGCGVVDQYRVESETLIRLALQVLNRDPRVLFAVPTLWDRTVHPRPTDAIGWLRRAAEAAPDDGARWRRLGNVLEKAGRGEEAVESWCRAARDGNEAEAVFNLARAAWHDGAEQALHYAEEALCRSIVPGKADRRLQPGMIRFCVHVVEELSHGRQVLAAWLGGRHRDRQVVRMSVARLDRVTHWEGVVRFFAEAPLLNASFGPEDPETDPEETQLEAWIADRHDEPEPRRSPLNRRERREAERRARKTGRRAG